MNRPMTIRSPIPPRSIVLWDAKYRKEGGSYPASLDPSKIERWKREIEIALNSSGESLTGRITGPHLSHVNAAIGEINAYEMLLGNGHYGVSQPGRPTAAGADFITYFHGSPLAGDIRPAVRQALLNASIVGRIFRWPECIVTG
jgi:hypothetical protein